MTTREIKRTEVFLRVKGKLLSQTQAAKELNISIRHIQRLYRKFKIEGARALASKRRGKPSNRQLQLSIKCRVEELITCEMYARFGLVFMCETLSKRH